jgi:hypothetical protein
VVVVVVVMTWPWRGRGGGGRGCRHDMAVERAGRWSLSLSS